MTKIAPPQEALPDSLAAVARTPGGTDGHDFATLLTEVAGETNFRTDARNAGSGAAGPFQFVKNTWLAMMREYGTEMGVKPELVAEIRLDAKGHPHVAHRQALEDLLALRYDPVLAAKMAGKYLDEGRAQLTHMLHRDPSEAEVHLAFLLGPTGAAHLIRTAQSHPETPVDRVVGAAARANRSLFLEHDGRPRTARGALAFLEQKYRADKQRVERYVTAAPTPPGTRIET